jgi:carbonic anhydrase
MSFGKPWAYSDSSNWARRGYPQSKGNNQSPINITPDKTTDCSMLCKISLKYSASKCIATVKNKTPIVYFDAGSYIKYTKNKDILSLKCMTIHTPSLHTINGNYYDMEVVLYHKLAGNLNPDSENWVPGGTAISILFQKGADYGEQNTFFNSFIYKLPIDKESIKNQIDIPVGENWGAEQLIPQIKSYYFYSGSLPFPPNEENWNWIVFEEIQQVSANIIDTLKIVFNNNIRPIQPLNNRIPAYNFNVDFSFSKMLNKKVNDDINAKKSNLIAKNMALTENKDVDGATKMKILDMEKNKVNNWYKNNKMYIKGILISIILLLTIYASLKMVKYIIQNDILNIIMVKQALGISKKEKETSPTKTKKNNNNNNDNNNNNNNNNNNV